MSTTWDAIVLGADPNGLAAAITLARAGRRTLLVEEGAAVGGLHAGAEFCPGYRHVGVLHDADGVRPWVGASLGLAEHGWAARARPSVVLPREGGARRIDPSMDGLARWSAVVRAAGPGIASLMDHPAPAITRTNGARALWPLLRTLIGARRALTNAVILDLLRILPESGENWLAEHVADPQLRAAVLLPALFGAYMGPLSPQSAGLLLVREATAGPGSAGGPAGLVSALERAVRAAGVEIRCGVSVDAIETSGGAARGARVDGASVAAKVVLSALDPRRTVLALLAGGAAPPELEDEVRRIRVRATSAKLHLAVAGPVRVLGADGPVEAFRVVRDPFQVERAFDAAKHGRIPQDPPLDVLVPTVADPALAPSGHSVLSVQVFGAPGEGWTDERRGELLHHTLAALGRALAAPLEIVGSELLVPPDLERRYGVTGGHPMHGEHALDQWWVGRPGPRTSGHATPIPGLFLGSSGAHPGGWSPGAAGIFAARRATEGR